MPPKLQYKDTAHLMEPHCHGRAPKTLAVLHETVSPDYPGWVDVDGVEAYLASKDYGIHGVIDLEGHVAWALGLGTCIFWQAKGANTQSIGIEQVSDIPNAIASRRKALWALRDPQLRATAKVLACWHNVDPKNHPLVYSYNAKTPGVCSHWDVTQGWQDGSGHWDCWPAHRGGYYPILSVINVARGYAKLGYRF